MLDVDSVYACFGDLSVVGLLGHVCVYAFASQVWPGEVPSV